MRDARCTEFSINQSWFHECLYNAKLSCCTFTEDNLLNLENLSLVDELIVWVIQTTFNLDGPILLSIG